MRRTIYTEPKCICDEGFTGENCTINIDDCVSNPCGNKTCFDIINGYICACAQGFTGTDCEVDIDECLSDPCQNDAECSDASGRYRCTCEAGYTGIQCEVDIDECAVFDPCNGTGICFDDIDWFRCACFERFTGPFCQTYVNMTAMEAIAAGGADSLVTVIASSSAAVGALGILYMCVRLKRNRKGRKKGRKLADKKKTGVKQRQTLDDDDTRTTPANSDAAPEQLSPQPPLEMSPLSLNTPSLGDEESENGAASLSTWLASTNTDASSSVDV